MLSELTLTSYCMLDDNSLFAPYFDRVETMTLLRDESTHLFLHMENVTFGSFHYAQYYYEIHKNLIVKINTKAQGSICYEIDSKSANYTKLQKGQWNCDPDDERSFVSLSCLSVDRVRIDFGSRTFVLKVVDGAFMIQN